MSNATANDPTPAVVATMRDLAREQRQSDLFQDQLRAIERADGAPLPDLTHALTLWEPWASAVVRGPKDIENRPWLPPAKFLGQRIWIHAAASGAFDFGRAEQVFDLWPEGRESAAHHNAPFSRIIGCARIIGVIDDDDDAASAFLKTRNPTAWYMGPFGWVLGERIAFEPSARVMVRGFQQLWRPPADVLDLARAELRRVTE